MPADTARLGLYVHVPFCEAKCSYCDFYSVAQGAVVGSRYVEALAAEAAMRTPSDFAPRTVFIGGGTPTALEDAEFARLLDEVVARRLDPASAAAKLLDREL